MPIEPLRRRLPGIGSATSVAGVIGRLAVELQALAGAPIGDEGDPAPPFVAMGSRPPADVDGRARTLQHRQGAGGRGRARAPGPRRRRDHRGPVHLSSDGRQNPLRSNHFTVGGIKLLVDDAHNLAACTAVFEAARAMLPSPSSRLIGVVTAPGDRRSDDLSAIGGACAGVSDEIVVYELNPRGRPAGLTAEAIVAGARKAAPGRPAHIELDIRQALALGLRHGRRGDLIFFTCPGTLEDLVAGVALHDPAEAERIAAELHLRDHPAHAHAPARSAIG